jgi:hypothetical protein
MKIVDLSVLQQNLYIEKRTKNEETSGFIAVIKFCGTGGMI